MTILVCFALASIAIGMGYTATIFVLSRTDREAEPATAPDLFFVFMIACLNEEKVLPASLARLLALPTKQSAVLVIDDGSDDGTAAVARSVSKSGRVWLHSRTRPHARLGKGAALNGGLDFLREAGLPELLDPDKVIVCVLDADGRVDPEVLTHVAPYFADPKVGAVQIGVRMYNRADGVLARLQDMEFVAYTDIFQRGRQRLGSVGLGGNGQFMRLSALSAIGAAPWSDCLTEDLDLGVRMLTRGWDTRFAAGVAVHQQAVTTVKRLVRQRSRWFQGHLQTTKLVPQVVRHMSGAAAVDLVYHLASPVLVLATSLLPLVFVYTVAATATASVQQGQNLFNFGGVLTWYLMACGPALMYGLVYRRREPEFGWLRSIGLGHLYILYGYLWLAAGWWAVARAGTGRHTWLKTART